MNRGRRGWAAGAAFLSAMAMHGYGQVQRGPVPKGTNTQTPGGLKTQNPKPARADSTAEFLGLGAAPDAEAAARGAKLFSSNCAFCHGAKATGAEGPDLVRSALVLHDEKGELIGQVVSKGRPDRGMPAFPSLTQDQIYDIAEFLHMRVYESANRGTYKVQNVVTGNAQAGKAFFDGAGKCNTCHSPTGDLAHVAGKYQPADLQAAFLYPGAVERSAETKLPVTVTLPSGESISGTLDRVDDFNVSLYDANGEYHSWPRTPEFKVKIKDPLEAHRELLAKYTDADMHNILAYLVTLK
jgi:cytochrome c oxidase cbb3-type subunit 3